ncbi:MAG: hypothetical protein P9M07_08490 [Candidatus Aceula meridiana]|nr:hypothetical protein [Candidatus Aceula meridiana]
MIRFVALGFISALFQLVLLREFTFSIAKNELSLVVAIGVWLIVCSLGGLISLKKRFFKTSLLPSLLTLFFCFSVLGIHLAKSVISLNYYESSSLLFALICAILFIAPQGFLVGHAFGSLCHVSLKTKKNTERRSAQFFSLEALGIFLGGITFTFLLSRYTNPFVFAFWPLIFIPLEKCKRTKMAITIFIGILSSMFFFSYPTILKKEFNDARILAVQGNPYGPVILAEKNAVISLYINGSLAQTSEDKAFEEEFVHTAFSSIKKHEDILLIGRFAQGYIEEIQKYSVKQIKSVWVNPAKTDIPAIANDPVRYLQRTSEKYDLILMNIPPPSSLSLNRFFTSEFFLLVKDRLSEGGVFCFSIPSRRDILSPAFRNFDSSIINTLNKIFPHYLAIPSDHMMILARKYEPLDSSLLLENFKAHNKKTSFFTFYHLKDNLDSSRINFIEDSFGPKPNLNKNFKPFGFLNYLILEQKKFYPRLSVNIGALQEIIPIGFVLAILLISLISVFFKKTNTLLHAGCLGFLSIAASLTIYISFQIISGALFWKLGLLMGIFMAGLSLSSYLQSVHMKRICPSQKQLSLLYLLWLGVFGILLFTIKSYLLIPEIEWALLVLSFLSGGLTGLGYPLLITMLADENKGLEKIPVSIYAADLIGAFLGTACFSVFFIPFLGVSTSIVLAGALIMIFGLKSLFR